MTIPGIGPITATAIAAIAPPAETFPKGRGFAAWLGLVPRQASTGGKQKLGAISKMGERTLRRLLIYGGLMPSEMKRLKVLEEENVRLKQLVANLSLDKPV